MRRTRAFDSANTIVLRALASQDDDGVCRLTARDVDRLQKCLGILLDQHHAQCEFCSGSLADGTDGHGLGECVPVCLTCNGSGSAETDAPPTDAAMGAEGPCHYCGGVTNDLLSDGSHAVWLCHADAPGVMRAHHARCVSIRLDAPQPTDAEIEDAIDQLAEASHANPYDPNHDHLLAVAERARRRDLRALIVRRVEAARGDGPARKVLRKVLAKIDEVHSDRTFQTPEESSLEREMREAAAGAADGDGALPAAAEACMEQLCALTAGGDHLICVQQLRAALAARTKP